MKLVRFTGRRQGARLVSVGAGRFGDGRWQCGSYGAPDKCAIADTAGRYRYRQSGEIMIRSLLGHEKAIFTGVRHRMVGHTS